ncbi:MAG: 1-phosphofructokinase family hexose kinase [Alkalispirochaeta sp.]
MKERPRPPFLVVGLNPTFQHTLVFDSIQTGEVNRATEAYEDIAGKGLNVARVLTQLGEDVVHVSPLGGPGERRFLDFCRTAGVAIRNVAGARGIRTCTTVIDRGAGTVTELVTPAFPVEAGTEDALFAVVEQELERCGTVAIAGSRAPGFSETLPGRIVSAARRAGVFVLIDYRGEELHHTLRNTSGELPNIIKINLSEFGATFFHGGAAALPEEIDTPEVIDKALRHAEALVKRGVLPVITRGSRPALALTEDRLGEGGGFHRIPVLPLTPVNPIGSGDAFAAGLLHHLAGGSSLPDAIDGAHAVAAMNASQIRPGTIRPEAARDD